MHPITLKSFQNELEKIAATPEGVQDQKPHSETPASKANALFGLPVGEPRKRGVRKYEQDQGSASAASPDRSQSPVGGQSSANISQGSAMNPSTGPGGV